jgi:large subunit ribosomal protein L21
MYAIIKTGGKQYRVAEGDSLRVESLDADVGASVDFNEVLLVAKGEAIQVGSPLLSGVSVSAEVVDHGRAKKVRMVKFKRRKHHMKWLGHRQDYTTVKIHSIKV